MVIESIVIPPVTQLCMNYRTRNIIQTHTKQLESSQTGRIKYHIRYPRYPVNQGPTINNNWKGHSNCYFWNCYLTVIRHSSPQLGYHHYFFGLTGSLTKFKRKARDWYEAENENPLWRSMDFTTMLHIS